MQKIPIVICIDVEPDGRVLDHHALKDWKGFEKSYEFFTKLRPELEAATGSPVHFSWFFRMDPQVAQTYGRAAWVIARYRPLLDELERAGDEIGLHTHAWRWDEAARHWFLDLGSQDWVDHCVRTSFEAFQETFNRPCLSFRFGDRWMNNTTLALIERMGARFDLTAEPGQKDLFLQDRFTGTAPDYTRVRRQPYRPSEGDFRKPGIWRKRALFEIPLSTGKMDWALASLKRGRAKSSAGAKNDIGSVIRETHPNSAYEGYVDRVDSQAIAGWAYDANQPNHPVEVEIHDGETLLDTILAGQFRPDLLTAGKGDGKHAFHVSFPSWLKDGKLHRLRLKIAGSNFELGDSPREVKCTDSGDAYVTLLLSSDASLVGPIADRLLRGLNVRYLALPVRSDAAIDDYQRFNLAQNCRYLLSHPLVKSFVFEIPSELIRRAHN